MADEKHPDGAPRESLRDRFALAILPVLVDQRRLPDGGPHDPAYWERIAMSAYACAHSMMKERSRRIRGPR